MLPGLDMLRVFIERIFKKKNPFLADRNHLHYLLLDKGLNLTKVLTILSIMVLSPIIINQYEFFSQIKIIIIYIFSYCIFIIYSIADLVIEYKTIENNQNKKFKAKLFVYLSVFFIFVGLFFFYNIKKN